MNISKMYLFGLLVIVAKLTAMKAEVDCSNHPPHANINNCCELSNILLEEFKEKCGSILKDRDGNEFVNFEPRHGHPQTPPGPEHTHGPPGHRRGPPHHHGPHHECFFSCVFNETGILVDGELEEVNMNSYLNEVFADSENVEFLSDKFLYCNEKRKKFLSNISERIHGPASCNTNHGGFLLGCVNIETFKNCPESVWSNTDECNAVRDHINQCFSQKSSDNNNEEDIEVEEI